MKRYLAHLVLAGGLLCSLNPLFAASTPNIIVILSDDYGYGSASCYGADPKLVRTPNIDRLAKEGRRFTDANTTSSVCSPTRYSVVTGRYCWRTSLKHEVLSTFAPLHIETNRLNMASLLRAHGYQTAAVGKWHLGYGTSDGSPKWRTDYLAELTPGPLELGFQYHFSVPSNHGDLTGVFVENHFVYGLRAGKIPAGMKVAGPVPDDDNFKKTYTKDDTESKRADPMDIDAPRRVNERVMKVLTDKVIAFIDQQKAGTPFFMYFTPVAVHNPVTPDKDLAGKSAAGLYGDWIHELDRSVGRVLDTLDRKGFTKDTLVIFSSDNGGVKEPQKTDSFQTQALNAGLAVNGPLRGGKHHVWEGGFKVPFLVRWPGKAPAGTVCNEMVSLADILATTAEIVGEKLPPAAKAAEDSYSILPAILGENLSKSIRPDMIVHSSDGVFAIRKGPWKWIEGEPVDDLKPAARKAHADEFRAQLYNLKEDPAETKDVSAAHPEIVKEMQALLARYRDGGYSRELPPVVEKPKTAAIEMPAFPGKIVLSETMAQVPGAPLVQVRGRFIAKDGAVWASQKGGEQQPAALRAPLALAEAGIQYELCLPASGTHTFRLQGADKETVFLAIITPQFVSIQKQGESAKGHPLARQSLKLKPGQWTPVRVAVQGNDLKVQVGEVIAATTHPTLAGVKPAFALMASGEPIGFRKLVVAK